jgi:hypothetical protein
VVRLDLYVGTISRVNPYKILHSHLNNLDKLAEICASDDLIARYFAQIGAHKLTRGSRVNSSTLKTHLQPAPTHLSLHLSCTRPTQLNRY